MKIRPLCPELAEKARLELNEDPKRLEDDLQHMKDWIAKQPHLRARTDDQWILAFLRACKFSLERTKEKYDLYYTLRTTAPEFWRHKHNGEKFMEILNIGAVLLLPKKQSVTAPRVSLIRPGSYPADKYHVTDIINVSNVINEIAMFEDDTLVVAGARTILDFKGSSPGHLLQMTPSQMKKMVAMGQDSNPIRSKSTHFLNTPPGFETVFNFMNGLLNEKNRARSYVHNKNYEAMYEYIPKEILPAEYGGNGGTIQEIIEYWRNKIIEYSSWLKEDWTNGTDESKRLGKPKTAEDLFGVDGSFRQLHID